MSLIKSLYQIINPQISLRHFEIPEDTERGKINRKFISFNAENTIINNVFTAKVLAKKWEKCFPLLKNLLKNTKNQAKSEQILKTKAWVYRKAVWHPALVKKLPQKPPLGEAVL